MSTTTSPTQAPGYPAGPVRIVEPFGRGGGIRTDIARVIAGPKLKDWLECHGAGPLSMSQSEFVSLVQEESERAVRLMKVSAAGSE